MPRISGSLTEWRRHLQSGDITPVELVDLVCNAIEERDPATHAYLSVDRDSARKAAEKADLSKPLGGLPIAIKDNINVKGLPCTCASQFLSNFVSPYDATVICKLKSAGAIPLGRTNMDEFAMGAAGENSSFGATRNPNARDYIPGGSSSGSASAVADGTALAALGSDTGGSIRQPASHCGVVGIKPTYGRVSRYGLVAFASSLDQIGPITRNVEDAALMLNAMCGFDEKDSTSLNEEVPDFTASLGKEIKGMKIGLPREYFVEGNDPGVTALLNAAKKQFADLGAELVEISLPYTEAVVATYYVIACAEASSNLSRFDGVRYGVRAADATDLATLYNKSRSEGFGPEVKRRIILGTYVLSSGYYDAYYGRAQKVRSLIIEDFRKAFESVDLILSPTSPTPATKLGSSKTNPMQSYLADIYTVAANLAGLPGISVPCGVIPSGENFLPVGLQLLAPHLMEEKLLQAAYAYEQSAGIIIPVTE